MAVVICGGCPVEVCNNPSEPCRTRRVSYEGAVLGLRERNGAHDSDFFAVVWDEHGQCVREVPYASTAGWTYHNGARVDATEEVRAKALAWWRAEWLRAEQARREHEAHQIHQGVMVRSTTTRGKNVGVVGEVLLIAPNKYDKNAQRVKIRVEGEAQPRWLDLARVEVANPPAVRLNKKAKRRAARREPRTWGGALAELSVLR